MDIECPESIEEFEALLRKIPLCRKKLYESAQAKLESGAARTEREATRQLAEETGRPEAAIRTAISREKIQFHNLDSVKPPSQAPLTSPKPSKRKARPIQPISDAEDWAIVAISQLSRIRDDDPNWRKALDRVQKWLDQYRARRENDEQNFGNK